MNHFVRLDSKNPWPHRLAIMLACATFPLISVGGLVTTYDAGMAVPDWPTTYGYNLLLYPPQTWIFGPWDLFVEHGHRLLGVVVGCLTITLLVFVLFCDERRWMRVLTVFTLVAVVLQGLLGGMRVLLDERSLAMLHACVGPAFFGLTASLAVFTSPFWRSAEPPHAARGGGKLLQFALLTTLLAYVQLVLGAQLRHIPANASPGAFRAAVFAHLAVAAVLTFHVAVFYWLVRRSGQQRRAVWAPTVSLVWLFSLQLLLGAGTWVVTYYWPSWFIGFRFTDTYTIQATGLLQSTTVTAHAATGALVFVSALIAFLRSVRLLRLESSPVGSTKLATSSIP